MNGAGGEDEGLGAHGRKAADRRYRGAHRAEEGDVIQATATVAARGATVLSSALVVVAVQGSPPRPAGSASASQPSPGLGGCAGHG